MSSQISEGTLSRRETEFLPAALEVLEQPPTPLSRMLTYLLVALACTAVTWACLARTDIIASGSGVVVIRDKVKVIQAPAQGIITAILVRDGQEVKAGDVLIRLDQTESRADLRRFSRELALVKLALMRSRALLAASPELFEPPGNADPDAVALERRLIRQRLATHAAEDRGLAEQIRTIEAQMTTAKSTIKWLEKSLPLAEQLYRRKNELYRNNALSEAELLQTEIEINTRNKELEEAKKLVEELAIALDRAREERKLAAERFRQSVLEEQVRLRQRHDELAQQVIKAKKRLRDLVLRAPIHGIVQQMAVHTLGGVVTAAQPLLTVVPLDEDLEIEARIPDRDIGFIRRGQPVSIKVAAFPFPRYGALEGTTEWVGRDAIMDDKQGPVYPVRIRLHDKRLPNPVNGRRGIIVPGMQVTTDIRVGQRRLIEYFLDPLLRYRETSMREI